MKPAKTKVRIFSNGMMDYSADYLVSAKEATPFKFEFPKEHLDDVLTTLRFHGDIEVVQPPIFSATNASATKLTLSVSKPVESIFAGMPGAVVSVLTHSGKEQAGRNLGVETVDGQLTISGEVSKSRYVVLLNDDKQFCRVDIDDIASWKFADATDQAEVDKALDALGSSTIRPGTTPVRFELKGKGDYPEVPARVKWVVPNAAFSMTYRLAISREKKFTLEAYATVHNFTDQPWENTEIEIVGGMPHTFKGDGAFATVPTRQEVKLTDAHAVGGRMVAMSHRVGSKSLARGVGRLESMGPASASFCCAAPEGGSQGYQEVELQSLGVADMDEATITEVGGMGRFTCPTPVSLLPAKQSTQVPMFRRELGDAKTVLVYRQMTGPNPDRTFSIVNDTGIQLVKGAIAIDQEGEDHEEVGMGKAILETTQPGQSRVVVYATEQGVKVQEQPKKTSRRVLKVSLKNGVGRTKEVTEWKTDYRVMNSTAEEFELYLDHLRATNLSKVAASVDDQELEGEDLSATGFFRFKVQVPANSEVVVGVLESYIASNKTDIMIGHHRKRAGALLAITDNGSDYWMKFPQIVKAIAVAESIDDKTVEREKLNDRLRKLLARRERTTKDLAALAGQDERAPYVKELGELRDQTTELEDRQIPALDQELKDLDAEYQEMLKSMVLEWDKQKESD